MKKSLFIFIVFTIITSISYGQHSSNSYVISAQGGISSTNFISLDWSLGENSVETVSFGNHIFTQGFHQSFSGASTITNLTIPKNSSFLQVYPNPVVSDLNIKFNTNEYSGLHLTLHEITGRVIKTYATNTKNPSFTINVSNLMAGIYILKISNSEGSLVETKKIIKQ